MTIDKMTAAAPEATRGLSVESIFIFADLESLFTAIRFLLGRETFNVFDGEETPRRTI